MDTLKGGNWQRNYYSILYTFYLFAKFEASTTVKGFWSCQPVRDSLSLWREPQRKEEVPSRHNLVEKKIINSYHSPTPFEGAT